MDMVKGRAGADDSPVGRTWWGTVLLQGDV